ncbi:FGGY-family carbohydrate kinase [Flaviflexus equikiangi]|uniref:FGGY-family carbohydrate kinase n=1 Tax=Flaviflexus equikiangi TaxID=2758573 RepID=A0ABS2TG15_9ACTO|nr:FGGY-family carbohydrate kinase [Flaviflexus equikiangi]MBM9433599.1 FGGY-family carbohydrate kinase [Flaviflexus equikiangi]
MADLVIGIDIGTGSTKGVLADSTGNVIHSEVVRHETSFPRPGWAEHDPDATWWADVVAICRRLTTLAKGDVAGICISGIGPVFLAADERGQGLRPAILYGVDTRSANEIDELTERYGAERVLEVCGNHMTSQSVGPKIEWVKNNEPDVWERTQRFLMAHSYCVFHLTGEYVLDHLSASMCEPLYSPFTNDWVDEWVQDICGDLPMPRLMWSNEVAGYITDNAARITGLRPGTPVSVGSIDAFVEALSVGVSQPGQVMLMYGSTMVAVQISDKALVAPSLWSNAGLLKGTSNVSGGMSTTGSLTTWVADLSGRDYDELSQLAAESDPGSRGLIMLPYFSGERSPIADPNARGVLAGLNLTHTYGDIYRSALEATGFGSRHLLDSIKESGGEASEYWAVGGGTTGGLWPQIMSDIIGIKQYIPKVSIGASYGDALMAAMTAGLVDIDTTWNSAEREIEPNPDNLEIYSDMYKLYLDLYPATAAINHKLAEIQAR